MSENKKPKPTTKDELNNLKVALSKTASDLSPAAKKLLSDDIRAVKRVVKSIKKDAKKIKGDVSQKSTQVVKDTENYVNANKEAILVGAGLALAGIAILTSIVSRIIGRK